MKNDEKSGDDRPSVRDYYDKIASTYFIVATFLLMLFAILLLLGALIEGVYAVAALSARGLLDSVGLLIIGFAVIETAKFIAEEEVLRDRQLRSTTESRQSLTKFITIIVIAASLEALVMIFKSSRDDIPEVLYPSVLFAVTMFALVALGIYQWLSSRIASDRSPERNIPREDGADMEHDARED